MSNISILYPVFVQVTLTLILLVWMGYARLQAIKTGQTRIKDIALRQPNWPVPVLRIANCYHNQFETPVLFYAVVAFILMTNQVDLILVLMAWGFVAMRIMHAIIHTTQDNITRRFYAFAVAITFLFLMWFILAIKLVTGALS